MSVFTLERCTILKFDPLPVSLIVGRVKKRLQNLSLSAVENIKPPPSRKVMCYPSQLACPSPRLPATMVTSCVEGDTTTVRFMRDAHKINTPHMFKLVSAAETPTTCLFKRNFGCFVMVERMSTLLLMPGVRVLQEQLYKWNTRDDLRFEHFMPRVYCLLRRYQV